MSSIKQLIVNAIIKVSEADPALDREGGPTAIEARDDFIKRLLAELFPEDSSVPVPKAKKAAAKKTKEEVVVVKAENDDEPPPLEKIPENEIVAEKKKRAPAKPKKTVSPPSDEASATVEVVPAPAAAAKPKKSTGKLMPAMVPNNLAKIDPTWRKHLKTADKDHAKELEPELLKYLNAMSKEDFNAKKAEEHVADFVASRAAPKAAEPETDTVADGKVEADLDVVEFNGKEYYVNPETKRVYEGEGECDADGNWTNYKPVGYAGMAAFTEMVLA
jgi:hypothetical protein